MQIGRGAPRRNSTKSYVGNTRLEKQKKEAHDVNVKTYRGLRRRGEQRHGAGVLRPLLRPLSVRGHGCFAERQYDYKQRQTQPARKKVVKVKSKERRSQALGGSAEERNLSLQIRNTSRVTCSVCSSIRERQQTDPRFRLRLRLVSSFLAWNLGMDDQPTTDRPLLRSRAKATT